MKIVSILKYLFTVIGLVLLVGAFVLYSNTRDFLSKAVSAEGTVTQLVRSGDSYRPVVEFKTQEGSLVEFASLSGSNPSRYSQGEVVEVLYQEASPEKARINGFVSLWGGAALLSLIGTVFFLIGFLIILFGALRGKKVKYLKKNGVPVRAEFQSVEINGAVQVNGRNPYQILAQWKNPRTSELHIFKSENLWFDPTDHIKQNEITVLIERDNPKKYYVDISFLPKVAS